MRRPNQRSASQVSADMPDPAYPHFDLNINRYVGTHVTGRNVGIYQTR